MRLQREGGLRSMLKPFPRSVRSPYGVKPRMHQDKLRCCKVISSVSPRFSLISRFRMRHGTARSSPVAPRAVGADAFAKDRPRSDSTVAVRSCPAENAAELAGS